MDGDPELDVTLSDGRQVLTFQIAAVAGREAWAIVEPRAPLRVIRGCAAALEVRQRVDMQIAARLAAGWVPVDRRPAGAPRVAPAPLPPDLTGQIRSLLEALARGRPALQAADPSGQLWAACQVFRHQAWRFGVGAPGARFARAAGTPPGGVGGAGRRSPGGAPSLPPGTGVARRGRRQAPPGAVGGARAGGAGAGPSVSSVRVRYHIACVHAARTTDSTSAPT
jgi:hypothetical protein